MAQMDLKEGIKLEVLESVSASESDCGTGACGCGCGPAQEESAQQVPVVAGASDSCCEPGCGPDTCGTAA